MLRVIRSWCCPQPTYQCLLELSVHQSAPPSVLSTAANETRHAIAAEVARVQGLSENERQAIGRKYTESEELWSALEAGGSDATLILRSSWLKGQRGGRLPKRGDKLPPEATISVAELRAIAKASNCEYGALPVIALSHFWRTKEHPDPDGETLELIVASLEERWEEFEKRKVSDVGIIIDWCALYQAPRTPQQEVSFKAGLKAINQWYAHQGTTVWLVTAGADRVKGLTYWQKGWTSFEYALAMLIKPANTSNMKDWAQVVDLGQEPGKRQTEFGRPALTEPLAFFQGHRYGDKTYTNGADRDAIVAPKFRETMFEVLGGVRELNLGTLKWGDAGAEALAVVLPLCGQLKTLQLHQNFIGAAGAMALARAMGSMAKLKELYLHNNNIGDQGLSSLSEALAKGSLAQLTVRSPLTAVSPACETWHVSSSDRRELFRVPCAGALAPRQRDWRRRHVGVRQRLRQGVLRKPHRAPPSPERNHGRWLCCPLPTHKERWQVVWPQRVQHWFGYHRQEHDGVC